MHSDKTQVSRNARWSIAQTIISAGVLFILYRYLLNELGAEKLGLWSLILASTSLARLAELGFSNATLRFVGQYAGADKPDDAVEILETVLISIALPFVVLAVLAIPIIGGMLPWFVPAPLLNEAVSILPWAMGALWLGVTGGLVQSAIDGCGRMDQRNMVLIATNLLYLACSLLLIPSYGLKGVAMAQAIQAGTTLLVMWWLAKTHLRPLPWLPWRWRKHRLFEVARFALTMQAGSIAGMLAEPIGKALVSRFGGLEFLAYYEMANQVITRARGVLVSGFHAIAPEFAIARDLRRHQALFLQSQRNVIDIGVPFMALVMVAFPVISQLWIGRNEPTFFASGQIIGMTWLLVTLLMPAYFFLTGTGRAFPVALAHAITLFGTIVLGWAGGMLYGGVGSIIGALASLLIGNLYMYFVALNDLFHDHEKLQPPPWIAQRMMVTVSACLLVIAVNLLATRQANGLVEHVIVLAVLSLAIAFPAFRHRTKTSDN